MHGLFKFYLNKSWSQTDSLIKIIINTHILGKVELL